MRASSAQGKVYLLLRSGQPLLDVDGQFPGGDTFPCLGHVARRGGLPGGVRTSDQQEDGQGEMSSKETLSWKPTVRKTPPEDELARCE